MNKWGERPRKLWLVPEEHPDSKNGYVIVYHEEADVFGLGLAGADVGCYGTFLERLKVMYVSSAHL